MDGPVTVYRDTTSSTVTVKIKDPIANRRPVQQRIIKKHLQQKYLLCGFAIHAFIACPAYLYGIVVDCDREWIMRIWPAVIYVAIGQFCQSILLNTAEKYMNIKFTSQYTQRDNHRKIILCATGIICLALTICGCLFSSAWMTVTKTTQIIAIIIYGLFGGIGSSLIFSRTHIILEAVRPKEDKYVRKTIHLCGEAFCQLFLSFVFTSLRTLYGTAQTLVLMASLLINLIPLSLLITRHREDILIRNSLLPQQQQLLPLSSSSSGGLIQSASTLEHRFENLQSFARSNANVIDQIDGIEMQQKFWKNPILNNPNGDSTTPSTFPQQNNNEFHCNYMTVDQQDDYGYYMANINSNGVEIMEIIPEEDENLSTMRSSTVTIDNSKMRDKFEELTTTKSDRRNDDEMSCSDDESMNRKRRSSFKRIRKFSKDFKNQFCLNLMEFFIGPLRKALIIFKLYPATLLQSCDIFSYVMCLTVLPGLAISHHQLKFAEIPFLFSLLAFPWMCFALMTPRFGNTLIKKKIKWHVSGCISKSLALICISFSTSKLLLSVSSVLLGFGQAVSLFLQDLVIQNSMPRAQWQIVKYPMCSVNSLLIIIYGILAHFIATYYGFQACVGLSAFLYTTSIIVWFSVYFLIKN